MVPPCLLTLHVILGRVTVIIATFLSINGSYAMDLSGPETGLPHNRALHVFDTYDTLRLIRVVFMDFIITQYYRFIGV